MSIANGRRSPMSLLHLLHLRKFVHGLALPRRRGIIGAPNIRIGTGPKWLMARDLILLKLEAHAPRRKLWPHIPGRYDPI